MAPIKFEEDMKDKLEKRTIQPSASSWNTLSQRLDKQEEKSNKKGFWWLGIAASIVGILLVSNVFFNSETKKIETIIVEDNTVQDTLKIEAPKSIITTPKQEIIAETKDKKIKLNTNRIIKKQTQANKYVASITNKKTKEKPKQLINSNKIKEPVIINNTTENETLVVNTQSEINNIKIEKKNIPVTDNEIDALLAKATQDIAMQKTESKKIPLDYNGLLLDVEYDLEETVRDKMIKVVKKGYKTLRESVAERND